MNDSTSQILSPYDSNGIAVRNRVAVAPMTRITATEYGHPTQTMFDYYSRFAKGGFGLVTTEGIYTVRRFRKDTVFSPAWPMTNRRGHGRPSTVACRHTEPACSRN